MNSQFSVILFGSDGSQGRANYMHAPASSFPFFTTLQNVEAVELKKLVCRLFGYVTGVRQQI